MQLRYLQTLTEIGAEQNSTVVFPMPIDIIKPFLELLGKPEGVRPERRCTGGRAECRPRAGRSLSRCLIVT